MKLAALSILFASAIVAKGALGLVTPSLSGVIPNPNGIYNSGDGNALTNLIWGVHDIFVSPTGNDSTYQRGNPSKPAKTLYDYDGTTYYGVCPVATNGDIIHLLPGLHLAGAVWARLGVTIRAEGQAIVQRTNYLRVTGAYTSMSGNTEGSFIIAEDNATFDGIRFDCNMYGRGTYNSFFGTPMALGALGSKNPGFTMWFGPNPANPTLLPNYLLWLNSTNILRGDPVFIGSVFTGLTNAAGTNIVLRGCQIDGDIDAIVASWNLSVTNLYGSTNDVHFDAEDWPDFAIDDGMLFSTNVQTLPPMEWTLERCKLWSYSDVVRVTGNNFKLHTRFCEFLVKSNNYANGQGNCVLVGSGTIWDDVGSVLKHDNDTGSTAAISAGSGKIEMQGTQIWTTNNPLFSGVGVLTRMSGWVWDVMRGRTYWVADTATNVLQSSTNGLWLGTGVFTGNLGGGTNLSGNFSPKIRVVTTATTLLVSDHTINFNGSGTQVIITLPTAVGNTNEFSVKNIHATGSYVLTNATGAQTIDGALSVTNSTQYKSYKIQSDGANWWIY